MDTSKPFPTDWREWRSQWDMFHAAHAAQMDYPHATIGGAKNFLADEVLGTWRIAGRDVELSEVTFTIGETHRYVGVTFVAGDGTVADSALCDTFDALAAAIGLVTP